MINTLRRTSLFTDISDEEINYILKKEKFKLKNYEKNEVIFSQGDDFKNLSIIIKGKVNLQVLYPNGKMLLLNSFNEGGVIGEALVFSKKKHYLQEGIAVKNCEILEMSRETITNIMQYNIQFAENLLGILSDKVLLLRKKIDLLEMGSIRKKICKFLIDKYIDSSNLSVKINSKKELAQELGIPRPSLSRELILMKNQKILDFNLKEIKIIDIHLIEEILFN